jgi:hypothetical protein
VQFYDSLWQHSSIPFSAVNYGTNKTFPGFVTGCAEKKISTKHNKPKMLFLLFHLQQYVLQAPWLLQ